jgi:hypothetical protein
MIVGAGLFFLGRHYHKGWLMWVGGIYGAISLAQLIQALDKPEDPAAKAAGGTPRGLLY